MPVFLWGVLCSYRHLHRFQCEVRYEFFLPTTHFNMYNMYNKNCMHPFVNCMYCKFPRINDSWFLNVDTDTIACMCIDIGIQIYSSFHKTCTQLCCALFCCGHIRVSRGSMWFIYPYHSGLLHGYSGNRPATREATVKNMDKIDCYQTKTKHSKTHILAYFYGCAVDIYFHRYNAKKSVLLTDESQSHRHRYISPF